MEMTAPVCYFLMARTGNLWVNLTCTQKPCSHSKQFQTEFPKLVSGKRSVNTKCFHTAFIPFQAIHTQTVLSTTPPMSDLKNCAYRHERSRSKGQKSGDCDVHFPTEPQ
jgi:hypothetical protein